LDRRPSAKGLPSLGEGGVMTQLLGVSIIVVNFNYDRFLAAAIDSALCQDHALCEVIVVDDYSTDNSRAIISQYGDRIRSVLQKTNGGQIVAVNRTWPLAHHPILMFLDADDILYPTSAAIVAGVWTEKTAKAQFPLQTIDEAGLQLGHVSPRYPKGAGHGDDPGSAPDHGFVAELARQRQRVCAITARPNQSRRGIQD
jgi:glycosyltransferase involved in cell wall biosynthesis